jgi:U1 small nuclear ribonucleoprotein
MTDKLPPNLLALFTPRPPLRYLVPSDHAPEHRHTSRITGVGQYLAALNEYKETDEFEPTESWLQKHDRKKQEKKERVSQMLTEGIKECTRDETYRMLLTVPDSPFEEGKKRGYGDPFKTLFVARLSYKTEPKDLEIEFGRFGPIERVHHSFLTVGSCLLHTDPSRHKSICW